MRTRWLLVPLVAAVSACGGSRPPAPAARPPAALPALLGFVSDGARTWLAPVDPRTLAPRPGRRVDPGFEGCVPRDGGLACWAPAPWSYSPDRSRLVLARDDGGIAESLRIVDAADLRRFADIALAGGPVGLVAWPAPDRLLAVQETGRQWLLVVDVARRRVLARRGLEGKIVRAVQSPRGLVLLEAPGRLAVIDASGAMRSVALGLAVDEHRVPGLAVAPRAGRAYVVGSGVVADVDLATLAVSTRAITRRTSLLGRLRDWLDPPAYAKERHATARSAYWLGGGSLAVAGSDGVSLLDTHDWTARTLDGHATDVRLAGDLLLATGPDGLTAYGLDGRERYHALAGRRAFVEETYANRAYVETGPQAVSVLDLRSGRVTGHRTPPRLLLTPSSSWWDP